ncbi:MAG: two-component system, OmpR family, alkaline phosphatase synthesis response regulator PhoP [Actinomycetota bacterium]|jgi:DNA-binding response OmpR family regulator
MPAMATVLVVDDEDDIRELVRINLELDGHRVLCAANGDEALDAMRRDAPDLVLLDVMMPGLDGWEVLGSIKAESDAALAATPVMMVTARTDDLDRIRGAIEGAIQYVTKPFQVGQLRQMVRDALESDEPELVTRRRAQQSALEQLARIERGDQREQQGASAPRPHLTRLETTPVSPRPRASQVTPAALATLSDKQVQLLAAVAGASTVRDAAAGLEVSRSNVYASLRRIARKLGVRSVPELVSLARAGELSADRSSP